MQAFDVELSAQDIQVLRDADSIAAFFTGLGYDTAARIPQTPANLGLSEPLQKRVKRIELIADQDKLFQVYLFELQSVTVADIKAIGRAFRDKAGNFLFVVTDDYEEIEFVLLDRIGKAITPTAISTASPSMTPRRFSVDRRHPTAVHRRVLRRFTWTEADQFGQFDKLRYAYDLAYWSEAFFNNRGLFSDYYLCERLPSRDGKFVEFSEWREDPKPAYQRLRAIYGDAAEKFAGKKTVELINVLYEPLLRELGFDPKLESPANGPALLRLKDPSSGALLGICLPYSWGRELDRKDDMHDSETPEATPIFTVVELLAKEQAQWVVLTNGKLWRLYSQRAHSRATNYYEIDLDEILGREGFQQDIQDAFRYFWLFFRMQAFRPVEQEWQGKRQPINLLDRLLLGSEEYAKQLGESLKSRVFTQVFPVLAEGFIANMRQHGTTAIGEEDLASVFQGTLTLLYRLLFLLYAEARDLLPIHSREYRAASLQRLKEEIREKAGTISESNADFIFAVQERKSRIEQTYSISEFKLWRQLKAIFAVIDQGSEELNVPRYNGGLFLAQRERGDHSPEAEAARFLEHERIADRYLALALDLLARDVDPKSNALVFIDYKSLGVRQLGSIYEGLLEFRLKIAKEKLAIVKEKGREVYQSFKELSDREKKRAEAQKAFVPRAQAYLENDKRERRATGSYYTPDHIVQYIVEHAVGPVLKERLDALRPKLRQAQQERREFVKQQEEFARRGMKSKPPEQADLIGRDLVDELFNIKVLDPAMGSGHFLVEAVDFITDKILEFLNAFPWNPILVHLDRMRTDIQAEMDGQNIDIDAKRLTDVNLLKRHVLKRCVYGVDLNPMAVELAKVSLWLDCFTLGAPLSFLDHHLRWGNSLIGSTVGEVDAIREAKGQLTLTGTSDWQGLTQAVQTMIDVGGMPDITPAQVATSKQHYESALSGVEVFKRVLNLHTARYFVEIEGPKAKGKKKVDIFDEMLRSGELFTWAHGQMDSPVAHTAMTKLGREAVARSGLASMEKRFFHWELEFPEVFYGRRSGTRTVVERLDNAGFDAVVGNPPYVNAIELNKSLSAFEKPYWKQTMKSAEGAYDLYVLFIEKSERLLSPSGRAGLITPNKYLAAPYAEALRTFLIEYAALIRLLDASRVPVFDDPAVYPVVLIYRRLDSGSPDQIVVDQLVQEQTIRTSAQPYRTLRILPQFIWGFLLSEGIDIVERLLTRTEMLSDICDVNASTTTAEADEFDALVSEERPKRGKGWKIINTGTIDPFRSLWGVDVFRSGGQQFLKPFLHDDETIVSQNRRNQYSSSKLIFAKVARSLEVYFDSVGEYASSNTNFAFVSEQEGFFYLGLLNSQLLSWIYEQYFGALRMGGGYLQFQAPQIRCLPVPRYNPGDPEMRKLARAAELYAGEQDPALLKEIDALSFAVCGLTTGEMTRVRTLATKIEAQGGNEHE